MRSDGLRNSSASTLPASACGSGCRSQPARASASRSWTSSREKSARSRKRFMAIVHSDPPASGGRAARSTCSSSSTNGGSRRSTCGSRARAGRGCRARAARRCTSLAGRVVRRPSRKPAPCTPTTGPDDAGLADKPRQRAHVREQASRLDRRRCTASISGAGQRAAAEGRAEVAELETPRDLVRPSAAPPHGKPPPSPLAVVSMSGVTP